MAEPTGSVLVVDDDTAVGTVLVALLVQAGMSATHVANREAALRALAGKPADVVLTDLRMPGMDGMQLLSQLAERSPDLPVIVLTAHGTVPLAVEAMRAGAADFVLKPFDREQIVFVVRKAMHAARHAEGRAAAAPMTQGPFASASPAMREVLQLLARAAPSTATVLIRGASGTGKELAARAIHDQSPRRAGPFVVIHCAALPDALLESELFGHEKGAFTGAACRKPGRIELADGGTLFLDEIGDVPLAMQVKLLRVLQERTFERLGGTESVKVDVRFVAATHQDLDAMVRAKTFREDLYYRLAVVPIVMPPLRARPEDIAALVTRFAATFGPANGKGAITIDPEALERLQREGWPGNVRELQNFVERLVVLADGTTIDRHDVDRELARSVAMSSSATSPSPSPDAPTSTLDDRRRTTERDALQEALGRVRGNRTLAARILGISRRTLYNKLAEHDIG
ncbi:MAG TPA: sigma-54 dependent transcriptional regulator [Polyangiaceae bacterium]